MAICLPGRPSSMNLAATSPMRVAPRVITTNWITTRIREEDGADATLSPATNEPKARMTSPAAARPWVPPRERMSREEATLSTRRKSVVAKRIVGKELKSRGERIESVVSRTRTERVRFAAMSRSRKKGWERDDQDDHGADDGHRQDEPAEPRQDGPGVVEIRRGRHPFLSSRELGPAETPRRSPGGAVRLRTRARRAFRRGIGLCKTGVSAKGFAEMRGNHTVERPRRPVESERGSAAGRSAACPDPRQLPPGTAEAGPEACLGLGFAAR